MKYHILINKKDKSVNNNILVMDNVLDKGIVQLKAMLELSDENAEKIKQCIINQHQIDEKFNIEYITLDDEDLAIPCYNRIILAFMNDEPYKWFGNYSGYVMRLWGEDLGVENPYVFEELESESDSVPYYEGNVPLEDGTFIKIKTITIRTQIFD